MVDRHLPAPGSNFSSETEKIYFFFCFLDLKKHLCYIEEESITAFPVPVFTLERKATQWHNITTTGNSVPGSNS